MYLIPLLQNLCPKSFFVYHIEYKTSRRINIIVDNSVETVQNSGSIPVQHKKQRFPFRSKRTLNLHQPMTPTKLPGTSALPDQSLLFFQFNKDIFLTGFKFIHIQPSISYFSQKITNNCTKYLTICTTQVIITTQVVFFIEGLLFGKNRRFYDGFFFYTGL